MKKITQEFKFGNHPSGIIGFFSSGKDLAMAYPYSNRIEYFLKNLWKDYNNYNKFINAFNEAVSHEFIHILGNCDNEKIPRLMESWHEVNK